jgi:phage-related protein
LLQDDKHGLETREKETETIENHYYALMQETAALAQQKEAQKKAQEAFENAKKAQEDLTNTFVDGASAALGMVSAFHSLNAAIDTLNDPDVSGWEKFLQISMSLGTALPALANGAKGLKKVFSEETLKKIENTIATK